MSIMDSTSSQVLEWTDDILWEIAIRLTHEPLRRFKLVSKHWNKITREPSFLKSYIGHYLLIERRTSDNVVGYDRVEGFGNRRYDFRITCFLEDKYRYFCPTEYDVTNIEKGLCVFYQLERGGGMFTLCNVATNEFLDLSIKSPEEARYVFHDDPKLDYMDTWCYLGFEPVRGVYKLVRHFFDEERDYIQICTIGGGEDNKDLSWRTIDEEALLTTKCSEDQNVCVNGILYLWAWPLLDFDDPDAFVLVALNLTTETALQYIPFPDGFTRGGQLIQLGGSAGLIYLTHEVSTIWILKNNETWTKNQKVDLMGICRVPKSESVTLTGICGFDITYLGTLRTGEMLLTPVRVSKDNPVHPIYKYDHIQHKLLNHDEVDTSIGESYAICGFEDNIVPLDSL